MTSLTGLLKTVPGDGLWSRLSPSLDLGPHQGIFFLRKSDHSLHRVEVSGADGITVAGDPDCHGLIVTRDFGVGLTTACHFADALAGELETEVRLRLLDNASEWPRWMAHGRSEPESLDEHRPEHDLARLVAGLFESELTRFFAAQPYRDVARRLNDPVLVGQVEAQIRGALARWTGEGVLGLVAVHLLKIHSLEGERLWRSEADAVHEQARLEREHKLRLLEAKQAAELAQLKPAPPVPVPAPAPAPERWEPAAVMEPPRPAAARISSPAEKQQLIQRVLGGLAGAQPAAVRVRLFDWPGDSAEGVQALIAQNPGGRSALRIGEGIHVVVDSPVAGYLHVFNLGSSGEVSPMVPDRGQPVELLEADQPYLVSTGDRIARVDSAVPPLSPWVEQGPVNGFPERILAVVTDDSAPLSPSDLHPAWSEASSTRGLSASGFGAPVIATTLAGRPTSEWAWGLAEAAVSP